MSEIKTSIVVDLAGNLVRKSRQYTKSMSRFTGKTSRGLTTMRKNIKKSAREFSRFGRMMGGLAVGAGMLKAVKSSMNLEERFERLGIQANKSTAEMDALKKKIFDTAQASDIRVDDNKILEAVTEIVEMTGDLGFAEKQIRNIGYALQATGASGQSIGGISAELQKWDIKKPKQVIGALDLLNAQGKMGAFTLKNIATLGPRLFAAYGTTGRGGMEGIRDMGAVLQVIRQGTGSSEQATTAFEALIRTFNDADKVEKLQKAGIQLYDVEALKKGEKILRPLNELITEITTKAKGDSTIISKFFDAEALRAFNTTIGEFKRTKTIKSFETFLKVKADGGQTIADSARMAKTSSGGVAAIGVKIKRGSDELVSQPLKDVANFLDKDLGGTLVHMMANLGNDEAQRAVESQRSRIELVIDSPLHVKVKSIKSKDLDLSVSSGLSVGGVQ